MTPYELRFEIFKEARAIAETNYHSQVEWIMNAKDVDIETIKSLPEYPSYEKIEELANQINNFVSSK